MPTAFSYAYHRGGTALRAFCFFLTIQKEVTWFLVSQERALVLWRTKVQVFWFLRKERRM